MTEDDIRIVGFYRTDDEIRQGITLDCRLNIDRFELIGVGDRPMEFVVMVEQLQSIAEKTDNRLIGFGNDTVVFKEYRGIVKDLFDLAENTRDLEIPAITGVLETSLHGVSAARNCGNTWHLRSHFIWVNSQGITLLNSSCQQITDIINGSGISPTSRMISNMYYEPQLRERKARAIECEKYIGELFVRNGIVLPHILSRKIQLKRRLRSLFPYKKI